MALVIPNVARYALRGRYPNGQPIVNIQDMWFTDDLIGEDRSEALLTVLQDVRNAWQDHVLDVLTADYTFLGIDFVDLNSADGLTGSQAPDNTRPVVGQRAVAGLPPNDCVLVTKTTSSRRGERNGRMFLSGAPEGEVDSNGILLTDYRVSVNISMDNYLDSISDVGPGTTDKYPVVVHATAGTASRVTGMTAKVRIGRQGPRLGR